MSIYLKKDFINRVVLTLSESSTLSNPNYLFVFENVYNKSSVPVHYSSTDLSFNTCRYNLFEIEETSSGSTTGGISIPIRIMTGQYDYTVYEAVNPTLDISGTTGVVITTGRMVVDDQTGIYTDEVIPDQNNNNESIYD